MTPATLTVGGRPATVLGTFGKGCDGSAALNFGESGGANCSTACPYHPRTTSEHAAAGGARCYAATLEKRRPSLAAKLRRHESAPAEVVRLARLELAARRWCVPWLRVSAFGSVPESVPAGFGELMADAAAAGIPVHLPVETPEKAATYAAAVGPGVAVRLSATPDQWLTHDGPASTVAGRMTDTPRERLQLAREAAKARRAATGRRCGVCPAVASRTLKGRPVKCGECTLCADPGADVVYPAHG